MGGHVVTDRELDVLNACTRIPQDIWWLIVYVEDGKPKYRYFLSSSSAQLPYLIKFVKEIIDKEIPHLIFAIWHGNRRTDAFLVNANTLIKVLGDAGSK